MSRPSRSDFRSARPGEIADLTAKLDALRRENESLKKRVSRPVQSSEEVGSAKRAFIANISHEIRTPLNALLGMAQLLERSELDRVQKSQVKVLIEAGTALKTLLDDVIALSQEQEHATGDEDCDPAQVARTVDRLLQPGAWEKRLRLTTTAAAGLPRVAADARHLRRVLLKLAENAIKFTDRGGVEIRVEAPDDSFLKFSVVDTGPGIPGEFAANLFEPFSTAETAYARRQDGAGLGLAVAKRMVESWGGSIGFDTIAGEGTTFWFTAPGLRAAQRAHMSAATGTVAAPSGASVFLALKDPAMRKTVADLLRPFGNSVTETDSIAAAALVAGQGMFDAIIVCGAEADNLAAIPSVAAPLIAIAEWNAPAPVAAAQVVRWPAEPDVLYHALNEVLCRVTAETEVTESPAIDPEVFASLEKSLGRPTLMGILQSYSANADELVEALAAAASAGQWADAARIAQDIAGAAGGFGLSALSTAARALAQQTRDAAQPRDLRAAAEAIANEHVRVRQALVGLYPEITA